MLASSMIPALIPKKGKGVYNKNNFFEQIKNKYPELFKKINYPLSNIFINNLLKDGKSYLATFSKDEIPLIENNNRSSCIGLLDISFIFDQIWSVLISL